MNALSSGEKSEKGFGIVTPLLTTASGEKFGKSAGNAVSLDESVTNVFDFYQVGTSGHITKYFAYHAAHQFFLRTADADVGRYMKMFTLLPLSEIDAALEKHVVSFHRAIRCHSHPNAYYAADSREKARAAASSSRGYRTCPLQCVPARCI